MLPIGYDNSFYNAAWPTTTHTSPWPSTTTDPPTEPPPTTQEQNGKNNQTVSSHTLPCLFQCLAMKSDPESPNRSPFPQLLNSEMMGQ